MGKGEGAMDPVAQRRAVVTRAGVDLARELGSAARVCIVVLSRGPFGTTMGCQSSVGNPLALARMLQFCCERVREAPPDETFEALPRQDA
jgi:hypothetical protein